MGGREVGGLDGQRRGGAAQGNASSRFGWGTIRGTSQNGGRRGGENGEAKRRVNGERRRKGVFVCLHVIITV